MLRSALISDTGITIIAYEVLSYLELCPIKSAECDFLYDFDQFLTAVAPL